MAFTVDEREACALKQTWIAKRRESERRATSCGTRAPGNHGKQTHKSHEASDTPRLPTMSSRKTAQIREAASFAAGSIVPNGQDTNRRGLGSVPMHPARVREIIQTFRARGTRRFRTQGGLLSRRRIQSKLHFFQEFLIVTGAEQMHPAFFAEARVIGIEDPVHIGGEHVG